MARLSANYIGPSSTYSLISMVDPVSTLTFEKGIWLPVLLSQLASQFSTPLPQHLCEKEF
jgi:hypothetical protein